MLVIDAESPRQQRQLAYLGETLSLDSVRYFDKGDSEEYLLTKGDKHVTICVFGSPKDGGGFLSVVVPDTIEPATLPLELHKEDQ